jgi:hypothetical protein
MLAGPTSGFGRYPEAIRTDPLVEVGVVVEGGIRTGELSDDSRERRRPGDKDAQVMVDYLPSA